MTVATRNRLDQVADVPPHKLLAPTCTLSPLAAAAKSPGPALQGNPTSCCAFERRRQIATSSVCSALFCAVLFMRGEGVVPISNRKMSELHVRGVGGFQKKQSSAEKRKKNPPLSCSALSPCPLSCGIIAASGFRRGWKGPVSLSCPDLSSLLRKEHSIRWALQKEGRGAAVPSFLENFYAKCDM